MFSRPDDWLSSIIKALIVAALCVQNNAVVRRQNASLVSFYPARRNCRPLVEFLCFVFVCMYRFFFCLFVVFLFVCVFLIGALPPYTLSSSCMFSLSEEKVQESSLGNGEKVMRFGPYLTQLLQKEIMKEKKSRAAAPLIRSSRLALDGLLWRSVV